MFQQQILNYLHNKYMKYVLIFCIVYNSKLSNI